MRRTLPQGLEESVRRELARLGGAVEPDRDLVEIVRAWPRSVGQAIAGNAWPARIARDGSLIVHASSSAWAFELTQLEEEIRSRLGPLAPERLKFVPGPLPEGEPSVSRVERKVAEIQPRAEAEAQALAAEIEDPKLRELIVRAAAISLSGKAYRERADRPVW
jgi:Dna[CI] antecedent, DciA